jgi:hypothetical protein
MGARESVNDFLNVPGSSFSFFICFRLFLIIGGSGGKIQIIHSMRGIIIFCLLRGYIEIND